MRVLVLLLFCTASAFGQIPNSGFETWSTDSPDGWFAPFNMPPTIVPITKSTIAHGGSSAVRGEAVAIATFAANPQLSAGPYGVGFPVSTRPASMRGYYQFFPQGGDTLNINVIMWKGAGGGIVVGVGAVKIGASSSSYKQFILPITYQTSDTPDSCITQIFLTHSPGSSTIHAGSYYLLDDLSFSASGGTAVPEDARIPGTFALKQNYPNPFNPATTIAYSIPASGRVVVKVHTMLGAEVATVVDRTENAGDHTAVFSAEGLASGVYCVSLHHGGSSAFRPMVLLK